VEIKRLYLEGFSPARIAEMTGFSKKTKIGNFLKQEGIYRSRSGRYAFEAKHLIGKRVGKLILLERSSNGEKSRWKCQCDCGNIVSIPHDGLFNSRFKTQSCGCLVRLKGKDSRFWEGHGDIHGYLFNRYIANAKQRNLEFNVTIEYIWDLFLKQNKKCALSGIPLRFQSETRKCDGTASLDRIDSSKGYIEGNLQWVNKWLNVIKGNLQEDQLFALIKVIYEYKKLNTLNISQDELEKMINAIDIRAHVIR
jgi:hypothetical protein